MTDLSMHTAAKMARIALGHVAQEYPHKLDHVLGGDEDARPPRELHPVFFGSFDWHSCVHGWWTLLTVRRLHRDGAEALEIERLADSTFTAEKIAVERAYLDRPLSRGFERPYGWAWLLYLHLEAAKHADRSWVAELAPLASAFANRFRTYLQILTYPIRAGAHSNTAFALVLALEWAEQFDEPLADLIRSRSRHWFAADRDAQAWEPSGDDFLSPTLTEALLMKRVLAEDAFGEWFGHFLPRIHQRQPETLFTPATVSDRSDGKIAHLDGLNLSRAWCWRLLGHRDVAEEHLAAALPHVAGDYMGEHWLQSFALLALLATRTIQADALIPPSPH
ncbi:DUF2891 domain-containing protein [Pelagerythrobacter aerophilus]|uniref:DUF2891 domain-containing protein n=1 Tax=Pelagerythrobacter aerophilus TaxID=2306995 RepID=A0A418NKI7_9SPHN|nr:DUF2891 domain-containing protein [Pelagerythrobacter aerophilus]RIV79689.1 DUF2891 domain-containing protein [Pelagerythrobacter aerophilus]